MQQNNQTLFVFIKVWNTGSCMSVVCVCQTLSRLYPGLARTWRSRALFLFCYPTCEHILQLQNTHRIYIYQSVIFILLRVSLLRKLHTSRVAGNTHLDVQGFFWGCFKTIVLVLSCFLWYVCIAHSRARRQILLGQVFCVLATLVAKRLVRHI